MNSGKLSAPCTAIFMRNMFATSGSVHVWNGYVKPLKDTNRWPRVPTTCGAIGLARSDAQYHLDSMFLIVFLLNGGMGFC